MNKWNLLVLFFLLTLPPKPIKLDTRYAAPISAALHYIERSSPETYAFVLQNVNTIAVFPEPRMNSGEAEYNPAGEIQIAQYLFTHPELYFPPGQESQYVGQLIVHEARHEWQYSHWPSATLADRTFMKQDAVRFASAFARNCRSDTPTAGW